MNRPKKIKVPNFKIVLRPQDKKFILKKTKEVLESNRWTVGTLNLALEKEFARYAGCPAVAVSNGGTGLVAILQALEIPEKSLVICPTLTAPPTAHAILAAGMRIVFADSSVDDLGLDLDDVKRKLKIYKGKVKAVIAVHIGGWISPRIYELNNLCKRAGAYLIEDCAHALGSSLKGRPAGSVGVAAGYSLFMTKPVPGGEGGMVTSPSGKIIETIKVIRNYGKNNTGLHVIKGFNYKLSEFNAAVALWAIKNIGYIVKERQRMAALYDQLFKGLHGASIFNIHHARGSYYKYILILDPRINRDRFKRMLLKDYGVEAAGGVYDTLCHEEPFFRSRSGQVLNAKEDFPQAKRFSQGQVCLPLYLGLRPPEQRYTARVTRLTLQKLLKSSSGRS